MRKGLQTTVHHSRHIKKEHTAWWCADSDDGCTSALKWFISCHCVCKNFPFGFVSSIGSITCGPVYAVVTVRSFMSSMSTFHQQRYTTRNMHKSRAKLVALSSSCVCGSILTCKHLLQSFKLKSKISVCNATNKHRLYLWGCGQLFWKFISNTFHKGVLTLLVHKLDLFAIGYY